MSESDGWPGSYDRTPTPWGYWTGSGDSGSYWVEEAPPENSGYRPEVTGGGDAGTTTTWVPVEPTSPTQVIDYGNWETPEDTRRNQQAAQALQAQQAQAAPVSAPVAPFIARNPAAILDTSATASPVFQPAQPYYQTTNDIQSQYAWAPRSAAQPLAGGIPNWGKQQPTQAFDVNQFIAEMLGPKAQAQTATLPTPYPGK